MSVIVKKRLVKSDFNAVVAEEMLVFSDLDYRRAQATTIMSEHMYSEITTIGTDFQNVKLSSHQPEDISALCQKRIYCTVCKTESVLASRSKSDVKIFPHTKKGLAYCGECKLHTHTSICLDSKYQCIPGLDGKSCFDILHSEKCNGMWSTGSQDRITIKRTHKLYMSLCVEYGLKDCIAKKRKKL